MKADEKSSKFFWYREIESFDNYWECFVFKVKILLLQWKQKVPDEHNFLK